MMKEKIYIYIYDDDEREMLTRKNFRYPVHVLREFCNEFSSRDEEYLWFNNVRNVTQIVC